MAGIWSNFKVDVYEHNGTFVASTNKLIMAHAEAELDTIGACKIQIPLNETPAISLFTKNRVCVISVEIEASSFGVIIGQFIIHHRRKKVSAGGVDVLEISGPDLLYEFTYETLGYALISNGAGGPAVDALRDVLDIYEATSVHSWGYSAHGSGSDNAYIVGSGQSIWDAILAIVKANNGHITIGHRIGGIGNGNETFPFYNLNFWWSHGFSGGWPLAFDALHLENTNLHLGLNRPVLDFDYEEETAETVTRVYAYGAGMGDDRFTIKDKSLSDPTGFTSYPEASLIVNNTLEAVSNQPRVTRVLNVSDVKPEDTEDATANQSAANVLFNTAIQYLQDHNGQTRNYYKIKTTVRGTHTPGQLVHLTHQHKSYIDASGNPTSTPINIIDVDDDFILIKYDLDYGPDGILYGNLLLGEVPRPKTDGQRMVAEKLKSLQTAISNAKAVPSTSEPGGSPTNALLADGSVNLAGNLAVNAGVRIDNTDISELKISDFLLLAANAEANRGRVLQVSDGLNLVDNGAGANAIIQLILKALSGLTVNGDGLGLAEPTAISATSTNAVTSSHAHQVVHSSNPGAARYLLSTDLTGRLQLHRLDVNSLVLTDRYDDQPYNVFIRNGRIYIETI